MNVGFVFDIDGIIKEEDLKIPYLSELYYRHFSKDDFKLNNIIDFRGEILTKYFVGREVQRHIYYIVLKNDKDSVKKISDCLNEIQKSRFDFSQDRDEVHVLLNMDEPDGVSLHEYEVMMPCLKSNAVCIYSWLLDKNDYSGGMPISLSRRSHAIARLANIINIHRRELSLRQLNTDGSPIYNLFGDASVFFNDEERDRAVRNYYYFKNLQHLLNYSDKHIDDYLQENVLPFKEDKEGMDKRIDSTSSAFIREHRIPIEATVITEKTQGLLLKSADDDTDYLINATDNGLVFIDDLSRKQSWQMKDTDSMVDEYWRRISEGRDLQETITDEFLTEIQERVIIHKRTVFDEVNNEVSRSRRKQIDSFKDKIDKYLLNFISSQDGQYASLSEILTPADVQWHRSNIDCAQAFLMYLESGNEDYLSDNKVSAGDVNLCKIRESIRMAEEKRLQELEEKEAEVRDNYAHGADGKPSRIKTAFDAIDKGINKCKEEIRVLTFQLENWCDEDAEKKLTVRTRSVIAIAAGVLSSSIWATVYIKWIRQILAFDKFAFSLFSILLLLGVLIGCCMLWSVVRRRREFEVQLRQYKDRKKRLMRDCMDGMMNLIEKRYRYMLAFHGLKTLNELVGFVSKKREDLTSFHKMLFRLLVKYRLSDYEKSEKFNMDSNTIELNDVDVKTMLFGPEGDKKVVACCLNNSPTSSLADAFEDYKRRKVQFETSRFAPDYETQTYFDPVAIENEIIPCKEEHEGEGYEYTALSLASILPEQSDVEMDDVNQGNVGDCYFMATLASIAHMSPEYIVGKRGMIESLDEENRFFRVKFYDRDGNRVNVDIDNKFWHRNGTPIYAGVGKMKTESNDSYDPWVMAVEKAWAKVNKRGYDGIEGASADGKEKERMVEYSYAVTGKTAFYCMTKNVPDRQKLLEMMQKHVLTDKLPITLYSASSSDPAFTNKDPYLVESHAYALSAVHEDGTFDIFNPWNNHMADEDVRGKHYEKVNIDFIKDNFDVVVFFDIKEADFTSFERDLTGNATEIELTGKIENMMDAGLQKLDRDFKQLNDLMNDDVLGKLYQYSVYLFNKARIKDSRGVDLSEQNLVYIEPLSVDEGANQKLKDYLVERGEGNIFSLSKRDDEKQSLTILRVSPPFVLSNFFDAKN